ncbi:hypothetical protein PCANC_00418 [Puccinia coronata f. sp. avenae]|uniref:Uncharacterized protein n=1 Tax=Puccinia coronata f. sp. avenae TaxID=200324 RepID=A0A2N5W9F9_9BASI|nr:hypothetical protein PCANC_11941 [Puccinia coronata f. sp. avenae]PLW58876.1 hypothetical protein PCANC_00418 [Puccinia coronata f. sp. avenae]
MYLRSRFSAAFVPKPPDLATAGLSGRFSGAAIGLSQPPPSAHLSFLRPFVQAAFKISIVAS